MNRRRFTREFKVEAVRMVLAGDRPTTEVARELGLNTETLYRWKKEFREDPTASFPGNGKVQERDEELVRLRRENARLRTENAFLKKVSAYFAKDRP
jgi:transposase